MKICTVCGHEKDIDDFCKDKRNKSGVGSRCKECRNKYTSESLQTPNGKRLRKERFKIYRKTPTGKIIGANQCRKHILKSRYGITLEQYDDMLKDQEYVCKICGTDKLGGQGRFKVDHDHITGKIRGLLCNLCNRGLGYFKDNIEFLTRAIQYLEAE